HMHRVKCIASMLDVETDSVDNAVSAGNGGLRRALVICIGGDLLDAAVLQPPGMPRGDAHGDAGLVQIARDATANKAGPAKYGHAAHLPIHPAILRDARD